MKITVGADPEFFLRDRKTGKFISAYGLIPGTKERPHPVEQGAVQVDGMALEFNINPAFNSQEFHSNIETVLQTLRNMIPKETEIDFNPVAQFDEEFFKQQPEAAVNIGCEPDFNAYTGQLNTPPNQKQLMRTAAGHIHIGWTDDRDPFDDRHFASCCRLVKQLDYYLGVPSVLLDKTPTAALRREMYGKAGTFRPKTYGVEYRVLSNFWVDIIEYRDWIYHQIISAVDALVEHGDRGFMELNFYPESARIAIDKNDIDHASKIVKAIGFRLP